MNSHKLLRLLEQVQIMTAQMNMLQEDLHDMLDNVPWRSETGGRDGQAVHPGIIQFSRKKEPQS